MAQRCRLRLAAVVMGALLLAGCGSISPGVGFNSILGYEGLDREIRRFYDQRAWERNATCPGARMDAILLAEVIEETEDEIVARIRYRWRDEGRLGDGRRGGAPSRVGVGGGGSCQGIDERRFTLEKVDGDARVVAMSGPQRPRPIPR